MKTNKKYKMTSVNVGEKAEIINGNVALPEELQPVQKTLSILSANIKDDFCNYSYRYLSGVEKDIPQQSKGIYIIKDELKDAFAKFNVHLAFIDDLFKNAGIDVRDIDMLHSHEFTYLMETSGIQIIGDDEFEQIKLIGTKLVSGGHRIPIETYRIPLDNLSSYKWYNELKTAADVVRKEVERYKFGNYTVPEHMKEDEEAKKLGKKKQTKIKFEKATDGSDPIPDPDDIGDVFEVAVPEESDGKEADEFTNALVD